MTRFFPRRILLVIPAFIGITLITFALIHQIAGDPMEIQAGERGIAPARHAVPIKDMGPDQPQVVHGRYIRGVLHGDLPGSHVTTNNPVLSEFLTLFPATVELSFCAIIVAVLFGLPAGIIAGVKRGKVFDRTVMGLSLTGYSMPVFWLGLLLVLFFSVFLGWTPVSGRLSALFRIDVDTGFRIIDTLRPDEKGALISALTHLILPSIVLGAIPLAVISRMTRSSMLEERHEVYARSARAKGLPPWCVLLLHALRNVLIPVVTVIGLQAGVLLTGAILTETIFGWPGIGKWILASIFSRDYRTVQGGILLIVTVIILVNLSVDVLYEIINPRIRHQFEQKD